MVLVMFGHEDGADPGGQHCERHEGVRLLADNARSGRCTTDLLGRDPRQLQGSSLERIEVPAIGQPYRPAMGTVGSMRVRSTCSSSAKKAVASTASTTVALAASLNLSQAIAE